MALGLGLGLAGGPATVGLQRVGERKGRPSVGMPVLRRSPGLLSLP